MYWRTARSALEVRGRALAAVLAFSWRLESRAVGHVETASFLIHFKTGEGAFSGESAGKAGLLLAKERGRISTRGVR